MVSSLPRGGLILFWCQFRPFLAFPIKDVDWVVPDLIGPASSKYDDSIILLIVVESAIRARWWCMASSLDLVPFHSDCIERPNIIHICGVCMISRGTCVTTEEDNFILYDATTVPPSSIWNGAISDTVSNLLPWYFFHLVILLEFYKKSMVLSIITNIYTEYVSYQPEERLFNKNSCKLLFI